MSSEFLSRWKWCNDHHPYSNFHQIIIIIFFCLAHQMTISKCTFDLVYPFQTEKQTKIKMIIIKCEKITLNGMWKNFHLFYSIQPRWHILGNCQMAHSYAATIDNKEDIMERKFMWIKLWFMQASAILVDGINGNIKITFFSILNHHIIGY